MSSPHPRSTTSHHHSLLSLPGMQVLREFSLPLFKDHLASVQPALPCITGGSNQVALPGLKAMS